MWCISSYEYVFGEASMTKIFAIYIQTSVLPSQSSEYAFEWCPEQFRRYVISLWHTSPDRGSCSILRVGILSSCCWCRFPSGVQCTHILFPVLEARSALLEFSLIRKLSHSLRTRCNVCEKVCVNVCVMSFK